MSRLAERERISQPGMSRVVQRLAGAGLIERTADPADGRVVIVAITPSGRALQADLQAARLQFLVEHLSGLSAGEQDALCAAVGALEALGTTPAAHPSARRPHHAPRRPGGDTNRRNGT
jgi:DNA-binding MarR family transcriptional regulator